MKKLLRRSFQSRSILYLGCKSSEEGKRKILNENTDDLLELSRLGKSGKKKNKALSALGTNDAK